MKVKIKVLDQIIRIFSLSFSNSKKCHIGKFYRKFTMKEDTYTAAIAKDAR